MSCAARLARRGFSVEVFERLPCPGGRANIIEDKGFKFDTGPSFVLMPDFFREVFDYCGEHLEDYLDLRALDPSYKLFYADGDTFTVHKDSLKTMEEVERLSPGAGAGFEGFIKETGRIYNQVRPLLYKCFTAKAMANPRYWGLVPKIRAFDSYWKLAKKFFKSDKLCYAFTFEAMFMGVSPYDAPAFYSVISYADHAQKIYHPMGGMYQIPLALEKLAKKFGAQFHYSSEVKDVHRLPQGVGIEVNGQRLAFDAVIANADYAYTQSELLRRNIPDYKYSCSVYLLYLGLKKKIHGLEHHNLFFAKDLDRNLRQIFKDKVLPDDPSFYVHVPTLTDPSLAPEGKDIFYLLVPVPNLQKAQPEMPKWEQSVRARVFERVNKIAGSNIEELIETERKFYPHDFISRYNIKFGATFGLAHNLMQSAFFRPANFDSRIKGLYFAGASVQPGGGLPVVIASSRIAAELL